MSADVANEALIQHLLQVGAASAEQIDAARRAQEWAAQQGKQVSIGEVLVQQGVLTQAFLTNIEKKVADKKQGIQRLGPYKLIKKLGEGAMGLVYLAEDTQAQRPVALKVLSAKLASEERFLKRFRREAIATGKLNHINIVSAYACDEDNGYHYYAMEYCDGEPLDKTLKKLGKFPIEMALDVITQIVRGLQHAHKNNIIHRDIKPANIFLTKDKVAKILDLGLSKNVGDSQQSHMTMEGTAVGTPHYISPEQARGEVDVDGRADIYSLGASFFLLVTGETPYNGNSPAVIMTKHLTAPVPDPQTITPSVPKPVAQIIMKMMQKDPKDRYQNCDQILIDLERVTQGEAPLLGAAAPAEDEGGGEERQRGGRQKAAPVKKIPTGRHTPVKAHDKVRSAPEPEPASDHRERESREKPRVRTGQVVPVRKEPESDERPPSTSVEPLEIPAARTTSTRTAGAQPAAKPPMGLIGAVAGVIVLGIIVGVVLSGSGDSVKTQHASNGNSGTSGSGSSSTQLPVESPTQTKTPETSKVPDTPKIDTPKITPAPQPPNITPAPTPPQPTPAVVQQDPPEVDLPGVPKEPVAPPPPDPVVARAPLPLVEDAALETEAPRVFDKFALSLKKGHLPQAQAALDDLQNRFAATKWYAAYHGWLDAAYLNLDWIKQPWGDTFAAPAKPLGDPLGDRWDLHYNNFTYAPYERREWQLIGSTTLTWQVGAWNLDANGPLSGIVCALPIADLERIEANMGTRQGTTCGWALFSSARTIQPYVSCWTDDDGRIWVTDGKKTTTLKLRMPNEGPRRMIAYFRKNRAWVEVGKLREEVRIPVSPSGMMLPGFVLSSGAARITDVRIQAAFEKDYVKELNDANERARKLREADPGKFDLKVTVSSEFPCAVFAGGVRGQPDGKGTYIPGEFSFTVRRGSIISILQFNGNATPTGPVLVNFTLSDGKQTGTGLTPNIWTAWGELGNWKGDATVFPGWLQLPIQESNADMKKPAGTKAKYVMPQNRAVLMRYVFDPDDFK